MFLIWFGYEHLIRYTVCKYFLPSTGCRFSLLILFFVVHRLSSLMQSRWLVLFCCQCFWLHIHEITAKSKVTKVKPYFLFRICIVWGLMLKYLTLTSLFLCMEQDKVSVSFFYKWISSFHNIIVKETTLSPFCTPGTLLKISWHICEDLFLFWLL